VAEIVSIEQRTGFGLAAIMARRGDRGAIAAALGCALPSGPAVTEPALTHVGGLRLIGTGPGTWLALSDVGAHALAANLTARLAGLASISDQSSGYVLFRISGIGARRLLQRGAAIDFDPAVFGPGSAATTTIAHMGVIVWQVDDAPSYEIALFRSYAGSFRHWLDTAAAAL
jgi:sarcosine oxidase subunit gamma